MKEIKCDSLLQLFCCVYPYSYIVKSRVTWRQMAHV